MTSMAQKAFYGRTPYSLPTKVKELAQDYDMDPEDIAAKLDIDVSLVKPHMPRRAKGWILRDNKTGDEWSCHTERRAYSLAQLKGLTDYTWGRARKA